MKKMQPDRERFIASVFLVISIVLPGCGTAISKHLLLNQMRDGKAPLIVDVRSEGEYAKDHLPGAIHISFYSIRYGLADMVYPKKDPVVLYCEHGPRAGIAGFLLFLSGYDAVYRLEGHMKAWRQNEFPVEIITR